MNNPIIDLLEDIAGDGDILDLKPDLFDRSGPVFPEPDQDQDEGEQLINELLDLIR